LAAVRLSYIFGGGGARIIPAAAARRGATGVEL